MKGIQEIQCVWILVKYLILCPMKPSVEKLVQNGLEKKYEHVGCKLARRPETKGNDKQQ